jgi:putative transposase
VEASILIITPSVGFGELIRQALEEAVGYQTTLAISGSEALKSIRTQGYQLVILDSDVYDCRVVELWPQLRDLQPHLQLILIPPEDGLALGELTTLAPAGLLNKPFYIPNLLSTVREVLARPDDSARPKPSEGSDPDMEDPLKQDTLLPWLEDVKRAARYLARLSMESAAQAALITRRKQLWAYAGELSQPAAEELAEAVVGYWADNGGSDLARFIRLESTGTEFMLYATALTGDLVLALAFDARTPFSEIRAQAWRLARALATDPTTLDGLEETGAPAALDRVLGENPLPKIQQVAPSQPDPPTAVPVPDRNAASRAGNYGVDPGAGAGPARVPIEIEMKESVSQARPKRIAGMGTDSQAMSIFPSSPEISQLQYASVLVPRMPQHELSGDLARRFTQWLSQLGLIFGWRLVDLAVATDHLAWLLQMPPQDSPGEMVKTVRLATSERIFLEFPHLKMSSQADDFWAPGYLILASASLPTEPTMQQFVRRIRAWQGAGKS